MLEFYKIHTFPDIAKVAAHLEFGGVPKWDCLRGILIKWAKSFSTGLTLKIGLYSQR